jgi:hypothetical protein
MIVKCKRITDPYFGPHSDVEITTYYLYDSNNVEYRWHEGPNPRLGCKVGDILDGIVISEKRPGVINYKKSKPTIVNLQGMLDI